MSRKGPAKARRLMQTISKLRGQRSELEDKLKTTSASIGPLTATEKAQKDEIHRLQGHLFKSDADLAELEEKNRSLCIQLGDALSEAKRFSDDLHEAQRIRQKELAEMAEKDEKIRQLNTKLNAFQQMEIDTKALRRRLREAHEETLNLTRQIRAYGHEPGTVEQFTMLAAQSALARGAEPNALLKMMAQTGKVEGKWLVRRLNENSPIEGGDIVLDEEESREFVRLMNKPAEVSPAIRDALARKQGTLGPLQDAGTAHLTSSEPVAQNLPRDVPKQGTYTGRLHANEAVFSTMPPKEKK